MRARQAREVEPSCLQITKAFALDRHREIVARVFREVDVDELPPLADAMRLALDVLVCVARIAEPLRGVGFARIEPQLYRGTL